jgi:hypothetical protein
MRLVVRYSRFQTGFQIDRKGPFMKKIVSPIVLVILLVWTWHTIHTPPVIDFKTHNDIQMEIKKFVLTELQAKKPNFTDLKFTKVWTTTLSENKIKVNFNYFFTEPDTEGGTVTTSLVRTAVIHREIGEDPTLISWKVQSVAAPLDAINFSEGATIYPENEGGSQTPEKTEPVANPAAQPPETKENH